MFSIIIKVHSKNQSLNENKKYLHVNNVKKITKLPIYQINVVS